MSDIEILPMGPHEFSVTVGKGDIRTTHRITVPDDIRDVLAGADEAAVVRESVEVLLERKVVTGLPGDFSLDWAAGARDDLAGGPFRRPHDRARDDAGVVDGGIGRGRVPSRDRACTNSGVSTDDGRIVTRTGTLPSITSDPGHRAPSARRAPGRPGRRRRR